MGQGPTSFCIAELRGVNQHFLWKFATIRSECQQSRESKQEKAVIMRL